MKSSGRGPRIRLTAAVAVICTLGLALALPATGHKVVYDTNLQLKIDILTDTTDMFSGKVTSRRAACTVGRVITITHAGVPIATATSDVAGNWTVTGPRPPKGDDLTAFTPKKVLKKNRKHRHRCASDVVTHKAP
jgi:hypothetical protein